MIQLYYDSYSVAYFMVSQEIGSRTQLELLEKIYNEEFEYLHPYYKGNHKAFVSDVLYWSDYLIDKETLDSEFPVIEKDFNATGNVFVKEDLMADYPEFDLFFMIMRLRLLYMNDKGYTRLKLRTLLRKYGYKKRNTEWLEYIKDCMMFYHIQPYLRGGVECNIRDIDIDDMITFRVL